MTSGLDAALERGRAARLRWVSYGGVLSAADYAAHRGIDPLALPELEAQGELSSVEVERVRWYPSELLKVPPDAWAAVCRALQGENGAGGLIFVNRAHGALSGMTVAAAVAKGRLADVLQLARAWRHEP